MGDLEEILHGVLNTARSRLELTRGQSSASYHASELDLDGHRGSFFLWAEHCGQGFRVLVAVTIREVRGHEH